MCDPTPDASRSWRAKTVATGDRAVVGPALFDVETGQLMSNWG
jgi:hypothetical protein